MATTKVDQSGPSLWQQVQQALTGQQAPATLKKLTQELSADLSAILKGASGFDGFVSSAAARNTRDTQRGQQIDPLSLSADDQQALRDAESGNLGPQAKANSNQILESIKQLPAADQAKVLKLFAAGPGSENGQHIASILSSPAWQRMDGAQRSQLASVLAGADVQKNPQVLADLDALSRQPGQPLLATDSTGKTLLSNLATLSTQPLNAKLDKQTNAKLLGAVVADLANPGNISQGNYNSCGPAGMQAELASKNPAEYARIMSGLASTAGSVQMQGGGTLTLPPEGKDAKDTRGLTSKMFENSAMSYAAGTNGETYDATHDRVDRPYFWMNGLNAKEDSALGSQLFGQNYQSWQTHGDAGKQIDFLNGYHGKGPAIVNVNLSSDGGSANHSLALDHSQDGRMFFKNPGGVRLPTPPFQSEPNGQVSVPDSWVKDHVVSVVAPQDGNSDVKMGTAQANQTIGNGAVDVFQGFLKANPWAKALLDAAGNWGLGGLAQAALRQVMNDPEAREAIAKNPILARFLPKDPGGDGGGNGGSTGGGRTGGGGYN